MIDKSLPSVISAKLLFRRAAARAHNPLLPLLLLLIVLPTTGLPQPVSSFTAAVHFGRGWAVSRTLVETDFTWRKLFDHSEIDSHFARDLQRSD